MSGPMPTDAVDDDLEAASETPTDRRRGRSRVTPPEFDHFMASMGEGNKSRRTHVKRFPAATALDALGLGGEFAYLTGDEVTGEQPRFEILAELGQLDDGDQIRKVARHICKHRVKVKDAVPMIRTWRNGGATPGDPVALADEITRVIRNYEIRHRTHSRLIREALGIVGFPYDEGEPGDDDTRAGAPA